MPWDLLVQFLVLLELGDPLLHKVDFELVHVPDAGRLCVMVRQSVLFYVSASFQGDMDPVDTYLVVVVHTVVDEVDRLADSRLALRSVVRAGRLRSSAMYSKFSERRLTTGRQGSRSPSMNAKRGAEIA